MTGRRRDFYEQFIAPRLEPLARASILANRLGYTKQSPDMRHNPDGSCTITLSARRPTVEGLIVTGGRLMR